MMYSAEDEASDVDDDNEQEPAFESESQHAIVVANRRANAVKMKKQAMALFKRNEPANNDDGVSYSYIVTIIKFNTHLFNLAIRYVVCGASLHITASIIGETYQILSAPSQHFCSCENVNSFVKLDLVMQHIMNIVVKERFLSVMTDSILHLTQQQNLIA
ncbi:hypothetical protein AXG93_3817s1350 [Marchantia polymorpha subsp. ruderalis]|uniref:Uncharacterized protein n=1 Tax=Marchantia polymorpha subsp. ruderalis TaxID=1480154 RepID=A0A176W2A7_MARPO|nr:hypothetical protein AXG93_3817s1350 [Marchantia polymorpha subsp. ruderalis]